MSATDPIFPLVDRRAPLIERLRDRDILEDNGVEEAEDQLEDFGAQLGKRVVAIKNLDDDNTERVLSSIEGGLLKGIAEEADIEVDDVNESVVKDVAESLDPDDDLELSFTTDEDE